MNDRIYSAQEDGYISVFGDHTTLRPFTPDMADGCTEDIKALISASPKDNFYHPWITAITTAPNGLRYSAVYYIDTPNGRMYAVKGDYVLTRADGSRMLVSKDVAELINR